MSTPTSAWNDPDTRGGSGADALLDEPGGGQQPAADGVAGEHEWDGDYDGDYDGEAYVEDRIPDSTLHGVDVGVLGFSMDGDGDPFNASLYISDLREQTATVALTPQVLQGLVPWLTSVYEAQASIYGLGPIADQQLPAAEREDDEGVDEDEDDGVGGKVARGVSKVSGWAFVQRGWESAPTSVRTGAGVVVLGLIVTFALLLR